MNWNNTQKLILKNASSILEGIVLALDPSSGGGISKPGWAVYRAGKLVQSGIIGVNPRMPLHQRLGHIHELLSQLVAEHSPDVIIFEQIKRIRGSFSGVSVDTLFKGIGTMLAACAPCDTLIEIPPLVWKKSVDRDYLKSDEADAIYLGRFAILQADFQLKERESRKIRSLRPKLSNRRPNLAGKSGAKKKGSRKAKSAPKKKSRRGRKA